jgi:predicted ester cyclase
MCAEEHIAAVRRLFEGVSAGDMSVIDELMIPEFVTHGDALFPFVRGTDALKRGIGAFKTAFPDATLTVQHIFAEGDKVVARVTVRGTHAKEWLGAPPSGKQLTWTASSITRFANSKMVERWVIEDELGMMEQLGLVPPIGADAKPPAG